ncbi:MAG: hypothetical protein M3163_01245 [Actinomycetota bacterium]|nr:hypothetical protein [Actinomycetota bacterium]
MALMVLCGLLIAAGLTAISRWGHLDVQVPPSDNGADEGPWWREPARRYLWGVQVAVVAGVGAGVLAAGAGGRLAMRMLTATAGDAAQGRVTEADEVVGRISAEGTISFIIFTALLLGAPTGALYLLVRRWLPRGRLGGVAYGGLLLVLAGTRVEPLRAENPDFDIVGPGWLSMVAFTALVLSTGRSSPLSPATSAGPCPFSADGGGPYSCTRRSCCLHPSPACWWWSSLWGSSPCSQRGTAHW